MSSAPLSGVSIIEWGDMVAAPYAAKLLADLGAEVIKIEEIDSPDPARRLPPSISGDEHGESAMFHYLNAGKKSVALDLRREEHRAALRTLVNDSDILIHSKQRERLEAVGLSNDAFAAGHRGHVAVSVSAFGSDGPYSAHTGTNGVISHAASLSQMSWRGMDPATVPPLRPAGYYADLAGGVSAAVAALMAHRAARASGDAQIVDVSIWAAAHLMIGTQMLFPEYEGRALDFRALHRPTRAPMEFMDCADGYIWAAILQPDHWTTFTELLGVEELGHEEIFATPLLRAEYWDALEPVLHEAMLTMSRNELFESGQQSGVPLAPALGVEEIIDSAHLRDRRFLVDTPTIGDQTLRVPGNPCLRPPATPAHEITPAPRLGEHNSQILGAIGSNRATPRRSRATGKASTPLEGIRVLDLGWVLAGPMCGQILARMGAEVIKVESETRLDIARVSPPFADGIPGLERSGYFAAYATGKKSVCLDLGNPEGKELLKRLVAESDVVIENFSPGTLERLGFGYETLREIRPDIVLVSISAFGQTGPWHAYRAFGLQLYAMSGLSILSGEPDGPPAIIRGAGADPFAAMYASLATLVALEERDRTGKGSHVDISMLETTLAHMPDAVAEASRAGVRPTPAGNVEAGFAPSGCYPTAGHDSWIALAVANDVEWKALATLMRPRLGEEDRRFSTADRRAQHASELDALIAEWTRTQDKNDLARRLQSVGIAASGSLDDGEVQADPYFRSAFLEEVDHHVCGRRRISGSPWTVYGAAKGPLRKVPLLGEHTRAVLADILGLGDDEVDSLVADGVVAENTAAKTSRTGTVRRA